MGPTMSRAVLWSLFLSLGLDAAPAFAAAPVVLSNEEVRAELGDRGLLVVSRPSLREAHAFHRDDFVLTLGGARYESSALPSPSRRVERGRVAYVWQAGPYRVEAIYELRPGWGFVSKQLFVSGGPGGTFRVDEVDLFRLALAEALTEVFLPSSARREELRTGDYGAAVRFVDGTGLLAVVQNPFLRVQSEGTSLSMSYVPEMEWRMEHGPFASDRGLLAPLRLTGRRAGSRPEGAAEG
jgi:hypothetical protein